MSAPDGSCEIRTHDPCVQRHGPYSLRHRCGPDFKRDYVAFKDGVLQKQFAEEVPEQDLHCDDGILLIMEYIIHINLIRYVWYLIVLQLIMEYH